MSTGVEFRVTEEYDEDSPFSRPPNWRPPAPQQDPPPAADEAAAPDQSSTQSESSPQSSSTDTSGDPSMADTTGNGLQPADGGSHAPTDRTDSESEAGAVRFRQHNSETQDHLQRSALPSEVDSQTEPSVGRGQVYSKEADTPEELPAHIEVASQPDADQPVNTEQMDPVHKKPGVRRTLDSSGEAAPDRDAGQQGLLSQPQGTPQGDPEKESEGSDQGRPWWETAVASVTAAAASVTTTVSGAADSVKGTVSAGYEAVTKSQSDQQSGEHLLLACLLVHVCKHPAAAEAAVTASLLEPAACALATGVRVGAALLPWQSLWGKGSFDPLIIWGASLWKPGTDVLVSHLSEHVCMVTYACVFTVVLV